MKSISEKPAVLSVHEGEPGQFILRVGDLKYRPLVVGITKLLGEARSFVVVTPSDIKVFEVNGNGTDPVPPQAESEIPQSETEVDPEMQSAIDAESNPDSGQPEKTVRRRGRPPKEPNSTCMRCRGTGKTKVLMDGGAPAETSCPVCGGSGVVIRYGDRR